MRAFYIVLMMLLAVPGGIAYAEEGVPQAVIDPSTDLKPALDIKQDPSDLEERIALAKKMHEINPTRNQVNGAIDDIARSQPASEREAFKTTMRGALNYQAIEKISIDAMAETYTKAELQAMVDYFGKPEAQSAAAKDWIYNKKVYPEVARMLDQSMMRLRTGSTTTP